MIIKQSEIKYKGKVIFERIVMSTKFQRIPKLFGEDEACFLVLTKGAFIFRTPINSLTFYEGDAMLAKCGNYLIENVGFNKKTEHQFISAMGVFFYPDIVKRFFDADISLEALKENFDAKKINIEPLFKTFITSLDFLLDNPEVADENLVINKLKELLLLLSKSENSSSLHDFVNSLFIPREFSFKEVIRRNLYTNLSLSELSYLCNMSLASFKRRFSEIYKESPANYMLSKKLEKARNLILIEKMSIGDIAFDCGFQTISSFDKSFKKKFMQSPSELRLSQKNK